MLQGLECPGCDGVIEISDPYVGKDVFCFDCKKELIIDSMGDEGSEGECFFLDSIK